MRKREEIWRDIDEYPNYEVSDQGNVRNKNTGRILRYRDNGNGYQKVLLSRTPNDSRRDSVYVHRLVITAFPEICGKWFDGAEADHISRDRRDCRAVNLRVVNKRQNMLNRRMNDKPSYNITENGFYVLNTNFLGFTVTKTYRTYDDMMIAFRVLKDFKIKFYKKLLKKEIINNEKEEIFDCGLY